MTPWSSTNLNEIAHCSRRFSLSTVDAVRNSGMYKRTPFFLSFSPSKTTSKDFQTNNRLLDKTNQIKNASRTSYPCHSRLHQPHNRLLHHHVNSFQRDFQPLSVVVEPLNSSVQHRRRFFSYSRYSYSLSIGDNVLFTLIRHLLLTRKTMRHTIVQWGWGRGS
jgi:hypothetical protein